jgi:micrococcal nuclease
MLRPLCLVCLVVVLTAGCVGTVPGLEEETRPNGGADTGDGSPTTANATVVRVVDGDTVEVRYRNGTTDTVRLLGVDTPEVYVENEPAEFEGVPDTDEGAACLRLAGKRASAAVRERIAGKQVRLVSDTTADSRDTYGRLLAYLGFEGTDLNRWLVSAGHARVYDSQFSRADDYYKAESTAQARGAGVWDCRDPDGASSIAAAPLVDTGTE